MGDFRIPDEDGGTLSAGRKAEDPEGAIEEEVARDRAHDVFFACGALDVDQDTGVLSWRREWEEASDEQRAVWFRKGFVDDVGARIARTLDDSGGPVSSAPEGDLRRVLDFGELGGTWLDGYRLVITIEAVPHTDLTRETPDA